MWELPLPMRSGSKPTGRGRAPSAPSAPPPHEWGGCFWSALRWRSGRSGSWGSAWARSWWQRARLAGGRHVAEVDLGHGAVGVVGLEETEGLEAERSCDQRRGEGLQLDVVVTHVAVVEAPGELQLVLGRGQVLLQVGERGDRFEVGVVLRT